MTFLQKRELYAMFLESEWWANLSRLKRSEITACERCGTSEHLQSHHRFYRENWFDTKLSDLEVLCRSCHKLEHRIVTATPTPVTLPDEIGKAAPKRHRTKAAHMAAWSKRKHPLPNSKGKPAKPHIVIRFHYQPKSKKKKHKDPFGRTPAQCAAAIRRAAQILRDSKPGNSQYIVFPSSPPLRSPGGRAPASRAYSSATSTAPAFSASRAGDAATSLKPQSGVAAAHALTPPLEQNGLTSPRCLIRGGVPATTS